MPKLAKIICYDHCVYVVAAFAIHKQANFILCASFDKIMFAAALKYKMLSLTGIISA